MAKSGIFLGGKELLECELSKLGTFDQFRAVQETVVDMVRDPALKDAPKEMKQALSLAIGLLAK